MKIHQVLINSLLACTLAVVQGLLLPDQEAAKAQSSRPYIVLVNGYQNCCAWSVSGSLPQNAEIRSVPYSNFSEGGSSGNTSDDSAFLRDGADFINNQLDTNRPLILIGHSFGGDSVLKLLPRINRRIQFVAVIDPVRTGGFRASLKALNVPRNVDYFFNRWQENVPFPNDFVVNGSIPCKARTCDQDSQNIARNADFSPVTTECRWDEVTCPGFVAPNPLIGRKGRKGKKQVRVSHQDLPKDAFIQKDLGNKIQMQIAAFSPPNQPRVGYFDDGGTVFYSNGTSYCGFVSPKHFDFYKQVNQAPTLGRRSPSSFGRNAGVCPLPSGYFDNGATVFFSAGNGTFCGFPNPQALDSHQRSRPQQPSFGRIDIDPNKFMSYTGVCQ